MPANNDDAAEEMGIFLRTHGSQWTTMMTISTAIRGVGRRSVGKLWFHHLYPHNSSWS
jgi:hypothetical protein